ncbi:hypothetical protein [Amycolatopsis echigonensis]|uniref:KAP NTPase domain-containing protein n=1 Tax=Amycolatopsis echigonensis TaxID=2576905 RepID=A0A8E1W6U0_9PSEU|nr:hypothetical protein [Amycolatopsis echigonensis]MBB2505181.1 hypothetical protein [Amycolatopsis echigonensis]
MTGERSDPHSIEEQDLEDFDSWTAKAALASLIDETLGSPEVTRLLARESLRTEIVREELVANETLLAKIRTLQDQVMAEGDRGFRPRNRAVSLREVVWLIFAVLLGLGYLSLMTAAWSRLPLFFRIFAGLMLPCVLFATGALAVRKVTSLREWMNPDAMQFHEEQFGLGPRRSFAAREIVLPEVRDVISAHRRLHFGTTLVFEQQYDLGEEDSSRIVPTAAAKRIRRVLERAGSGAVALGGQRGSGKTTAIRSLQRGLLHGSENPAPLVVVASAPATYDARDFVLHLHKLLCQAVLERIWQTLGPETGWRWWVRRFWLGSADLVGSAALGWAIGGVLWNGKFTQFPTDLWQTIARVRFPDLLGPLWTQQSVPNRIALGVAAFLALRWTVKLLASATDAVLHFVRRKSSAGARALDAKARRQLLRIQYLLTYTTGWSGKLAVPAGGELGRTRTTQRAEQQLTHPEVVDEFRAFAQLTAESLRAEGITDRVVVAIDELDKIGEQDKAQQLVNDIKGIFGVPGCLYFVAVSDDAVLSFEQRGLAVRDAFDSAFSEVVRLEPFTLDESRLWIARRLPGVPEQFCYLGHCLSGGLPRDLRRTTIDMVDVTIEHYEPSLSTVTGILVRADLTAKASGFAGQARGLAQTPELTELWPKLLRIPDTRQAMELAELATELHECATPDLADPINRLRLHSCAFVLFCATVLDVFTDALTQSRLTPSLHDLALARRHLALDPHLAWAALNDFRKAHDLPLHNQQF